MNTKIIAAILVASIVAMATVVPMAMGDNAAQEVEVSTVGSLDIVKTIDLSTAVTAIDFQSGAPGATLRPPSTGGHANNATFALKNTYNNKVVVDLKASNFTGTDTSANITQSSEFGLLADANATKDDGDITDQFPMDDGGYTMDPGYVTPTYKYTWLKLNLPADAVADTYSGSTLTVTATAI